MSKPYSFWAISSPFEAVDGASIKFGGTQTVEYGFRVAIEGNIDRASGRMDATLVISDPFRGAIRSKRAQVCRTAVVAGDHAASGARPKQHRRDHQRSWPLP